MPKELFNQTLIEAPDLPDDNDRTAFSQPGTVGGLNMKWGYFKTVLATESRSFTAKNNTGGQIDKGEVVYISGEDSGVPEVTLARADVEATAITAIGIAINDIADTETGSFLTIGTLTDIDTSTFAAGDSLWLSAATAGALTNVKPSSPNLAIFVGSVRTDSATGEIQVQFKSLTEAGAGSVNKIQSTSGDSYAEFGNSGADEFLTIVSDTIKVAEFGDGSTHSKLLLDPDSGFGLTTGLWFGNGQSGMYQPSAASLVVHADNTRVSYFTASAFTMGDGGDNKARIVSEIPSATNPVYVFSTDLDTGIGRAGADQLSLISGGVEGIRLDESTNPGFVKTIINPDGAIGANTGLVFGAGGSGFYEAAAGTLVYVAGSQERMRMISSGFLQNTTGGIYMNFNALQSNVIPNYTFRNNQASGLGNPFTDTISLITGSVEAQRIAEGNSRTSTVLNGQVVETITNGSTTAAAATLTKAGENFLTTVSIGDTVLVHGGTTTADYGTYIVRSVDLDTQLTVDRNFTGTNSDVDFDILTGGTLIENAIEDGVSNIRSNAIYLDVQQNYGVNTGIFFGDGDTGIYESVDDRMMFRALGQDVFFINSSGLWHKTVGDGGISILSGISSATAPIYTFAGDTNTGIGRFGSDALSLISGGIEGIRLDELTNPGFVKTIINPDGAVGANTGLWFGDADTGFYESADDTLKVRVGAGDRFEYTSASIRGISANTFSINHAATLNNVSYGFRTAGTGLGLGSSSSQISIFTNAVENQRLIEGNGRASSVFSGTIVENITDANTTIATPTLTKTGENFLTTVNIGDTVLVHGGIAPADYGVYIVRSVDSDTQLTVDRNFSATTGSVDFVIKSKGVTVESNTQDGVARIHSNAIFIAWELAITASTTQSQGQQPLVSSRNEISVVANANDVVTMPSAVPGLEVIIVNNGANTLQIFPASGDDLGAGVDTSITLASGSSAVYEAYNLTNWITK
jgi:hypothetical protein